MSPLRWLPGRSLGGHVDPAREARRRARHTARALHRLDDRLLADIGIRRSDIEIVARTVAEPFR